ncbi:RNase Sy [Dimargaris cristalligena]|uniref:ribonuclease T2 n=1 Tax=Dimargaris cristalligena TaxID=215637 RepID=A0A4V1J445_9FUNG|nr:RNase Sy [Dimargaris cristalligena]|eukprot:RKP34279.1 RNase Sy [Dimargaris cristalligena]
MRYLVLSALLVFCGTTAALPERQLVIQGEAPFPTPSFNRDSCPIDQRSCTNEQADSCCTPKNGLLVFAQQWELNYGPKKSFTIHGLWPDLCDGTFLPANGCDRDRNYDDIASIVRRRDSSLLEWMNQYWPSNRNNNNVFWAHEWNKHGTCVTTLDPKCYGDTYKPQQEVADYFNQVKGVYEANNLYQALSNQGIIPGSSYPLVNMAAAIRRELGVEPRFSCRRGRIQEIRMWFYVKGSTNYIPAPAMGGHSCPKMVFYPAK